MSLTFRPADLRELRSGWRVLLGSTLGLSAGYMLNPFVIGIMAPHIIRGLGWSKSQFALVGILSLATTLAFPFAGRLTDRIGVRRTAAIGVVCSPLLYVAYGRMNTIGEFMALWVFQCTILTTVAPSTYCRIIVQHFERARGTALAIAAVTLPLLTAVFGPVLNQFMIANGWRAGFLIVAAFTAVAGPAALLLLPREHRVAAPAERPRAAREDYRLLLRSRAFRILAAAMLLSNLAHPVMVTQLNLALVQNGVALETVSTMIALFAGGVIIGRLASGLALDLLPAPFVAAGSLTLSAIGLLGVASPIDATGFLAVSVVLMGLSYGSEADVLAYLVMQLFGVRIYSSISSLISSIFSISTALGAALLGLTLRPSGSFAPFFTISAVSILMGAVLLLILPRGIDRTISGDTEADAIDRALADEPRAVAAGVPPAA